MNGDYGFETKDAPPVCTGPGCDTSFLPRVVEPDRPASPAPSAKHRSEHEAEKAAAEAFERLFPPDTRRRSSSPLTSPSRAAVRSRSVCSVPKRRDRQAELERAGREYRISDWQAGIGDPKYLYVDALGLPDDQRKAERWLRRIFEDFGLPAAPVKFFRAVRPTDTPWLLALDSVIFGHDSDLWGRVADKGGKPVVWLNRDTGPWALEEVVAHESFHALVRHGAMPRYDGDHDSRADAFERLVAPQLARARPIDYGDFPPPETRGRQALSRAAWEGRGRMIAHADRRLREAMAAT